MFHSKRINPSISKNQLEPHIMSQQQSPPPSSSLSLSEEDEYDIMYALKKNSENKAAFVREMARTRHEIGRNLLATNGIKAGVKVASFCASRMVNCAKVTPLITAVAVSGGTALPSLLAFLVTEPTFSAEMLREVGEFAFDDFEGKLKDWGLEMEDLTNPKRFKAVLKRKVKDLCEGKSSAESCAKIAGMLGGATETLRQGAKVKKLETAE